jgi:hypothetical protein
MSEIKCEIIKKTGMLSKSDLPGTLSKCRGDGKLLWRASEMVIIRLCEINIRRTWEIICNGHSSFFP